MHLNESTTDTPSPSSPPFEPFSWAGILCPGRRQRLARLDMVAEDHEDFEDQRERWGRTHDDPGDIEPEDA